MENIEEKDAEEIDGIYDEKGHYVRESLKKETTQMASKEEYLKCVTCFIVDKEGNVLIEKRNPKRAKEPGELDLCSETVKQNEVYTQAVIRGLEEELSIPKQDSIDAINAGKLKRIGNVTARFPGRKCLTDVYLLFKDEIIPEEIKFDDAEIQEVFVMKYKLVLKLLRKSLLRVPYVKEFEPVLQKVEEEIQRQIGESKKEIKEETDLEK